MAIHLSASQCMKLKTLKGEWIIAQYSKVQFIPDAIGKCAKYSHFTG